LRNAKTVWKKGFGTGLGRALLGGVTVFMNNAPLFGGRNQAVGVGLVRGKHKGKHWWLLTSANVNARDDSESPDQRAESRAERQKWSVTCNKKQSWRESRLPAVK
jgi:hypothetical protein